MRHVKRSALVAQSPERMFALINDIERYPEFIPWCTDARVVTRTPQEIVATLGVKRGLLRAHFTTRNLLEPVRAIRMHLVDGPFRQLDGGWTLAPILPSMAVGARETLGCRVELELRFELANAISAALLEPLFEETAGSLVDAFVARARQTAPVS